MTETWNIGDGARSGQLWARERVVDLRLPWPPSGNRYWRIFVPPHKPTAARMIRSAEATRYIKQVVRLVSSGWADLEQFTGRLQVAVVCRAPDRRRYDLDNRCKVLLDALQRSGVIAGDHLIDELRVTRGGAVQPPRVEVRITEGVI